MSIISDAAPANRARTLFTSVENEADSFANYLNKIEKHDYKAYPETELMSSNSRVYCG
jgi:hypothetical protein